MKKLQYSNKKKESAFTLLEIMLASLIATIILGAVYSGFRAGLYAWKRANQKFEMYQNAQGFLNQITKEIRSSFITQQNGLFYFQGDKESMDFFATLKSDAT